MIGRVYKWPVRNSGQRGVWPGGLWRVICRWRSIPGVKTVRNVLVENVETGERKTRPWYPAPAKVDDAELHRTLLETATDRKGRRTP